MTVTDRCLQGRVSVKLLVNALSARGEVALNVMRLLSMGEVALNAAGVAAAGKGLLIKAMGKMPKMIIRKIFGFCAHIVPIPENPYFLPLT